MIWLKLIIISAFALEPSSFWRYPLSGIQNYVDHNVTKRSSAPVRCKLDNLKIVNCDIIVSRLGNEKISATFDKTCEIKDTKYIFSFGREGGYLINFETQNPFITMHDMKKKLHKIFLEIGTHFVWVKVHAKTLRNQPVVGSSQQCNFYVRPENATASLGRLNRNVRKGSTIVVDASKSTNNDVGKFGVGLIYRWNCSDSIGFCKGRDLGTGSKVVIPQEFIEEGAQFTFTVEVRTEQTTWQTALQFIKVNSNRPYVVNCVKNCGKEPNTWNPLTKPWIFSECQFLCKKFRRQMIKGKLFNAQEKVVEYYANIATNPVSIEDVKKPGERYKMRVYYEEKKKETLVGETEFYTYPIPKLQNCKSVPERGNALTKFKISCDYDKETAKMFRLQILTNNTVVYSLNAESLEDIEFVVASGSKVYITIEDVNQVTYNQTVAVEVDPIHGGGSVADAADALKDAYGGADGDNHVFKLIQQGEYGMALQIIGMISSALSDLKITNDNEKSLVQKLKKELLSDIIYVPINNIDTAKSVSGIVSMLAKTNADDVSDADMARLFASICKELAKKQLYLMENDHAGDIKDQDAATIARNLLSCGESETLPSFDIFNETEIDFDITTKYPIKPELSEGSFEDYPQYVSDDIIEDKVKDFIDAAENILELCRDTSHSLLVPLPKVMSAPKYIHGRKSIIAVMKSPGRIIATAKFEQHAVTIIPGPFFKGIKSILTMRVCSYSYNPFWSASLDVLIPTSVLDVGVMKMTDKQEIINFGNSPMNISFELLENSKVKTKITNTDINKPDRTSKFKEDDFTIFIIEVKKKESFFVEFYNLTDEDDIEVALLDMERPSLRHFFDGIHVDSKKNKFFIEVNEHNHDTWYLMGMKPNSAMKVDGSMGVSFSVYTPRCVMWDSQKKKWKFACTVYVTTTHKKIHCRCFHLSTLAGSVEYNILKKHPEFLEINFILEMEGSLFIIAIVTFFFFMYFLLLMYSAKRDEALEDAVFFIADVPSHCRYAYLIVVATGHRIGSGTTSDIVIEVFGQNGSSLKHVLNFPDPFMELLQRSGEDYLVFASNSYLGPLRKIHLWFDCSGTSPDWFCHSVKICDLQTHHWYKFKVKKWLQIDGRTPRLFMNVPVSHKVTSDSHLTKKRLLYGLLKFGQLNHTIWQLMKRSNNPHLGPTKRLTLMLSVILTVMSVAQKFHASPEFLPRDSITEYCFYNFRPNNVFIGLYSAVITYFPHLGIVTGFKKSKLQFQSKTQKNVSLLPTAFTYVLWVIVTVNILIQSHLLLIYGCRIIYPTILDWTLSTGVAMIFYIFFIEFVFNLLLDILIRTSHATQLNFGTILRHVEAQRKYLYSLYGHYIYRPILDPVYDFLTKAKYLARRIYYRQKRDVLWQIQDLFMTIALTIFFYLIILGERDQVYDIAAHEEVLQLINGAENKPVKLDTVTQASDFVEYLVKTFLPNLQSYQWYGRYMSKNPGMTSDACNRFLGVARLRQHRVDAESCTVAEQMRFLNRTCYSSDYFFQYDHQNYTPHWNSIIPDYEQTRMGPVWGFQENTGDFYVGDSAYYPVGGYIALLGRTMKNSLMNFNYLTRKDWMDYRTRAIVIEFCLYNVNSNIFHFVGILAERTGTGFINTYVGVTTERILKYGGRTNTISFICAIFFIIFVVLISFRIALRIIKTRTWYKRDFWHVLDVGIVVLSISWLSMHFKKLRLLQDFAKELEEKRSDSFINFFPMLEVINVLSFLSSFLVGLTILRIWKLLRFVTVFRMVERTLLLSLEALYILSIILAIFLIGFGFMSYVFLGTQIREFKDWYNVLKILLNLMCQTQKDSPRELGLNERGLGYVFFVLYAVFCVIMRTMFVAIIVYNYKKAQRFAFEERIEYSMKDYVFEKLRHLKLLTAMWVDKFRLKAGGKMDHENVNPKETSVRYMNFVETDSNRMEAMASVAKCVLAKKLKGLRVDDSDHAMMMKTIKNLQNKESGKREIFFVEGNSISGFTFVDDNKMLRMEKIVKSILELPQERAARRKATDLLEALEADNLARIMSMNYRLKLMVEAVKNIEIFIATKR